MSPVVRQSIAAPSKSAIDISHTQFETVPTMPNQSKCMTFLHQCKTTLSRRIISSWWRFDIQCILFYIRKSCAHIRYYLIYWLNVRYWFSFFFSLLLGDFSVLLSIVVVMAWRRSDERIRYVFADTHTHTTKVRVSKRDTATHNFVCHNFDRPQTKDCAMPTKK